MEIFVDFGLFELLVAAGLSAAARRIFAHKRLAVLLLTWSIVAPVTLIVAANDEMTRWLAVGCLVPALISSAALASMMRRYDLADLLVSQNGER